MSRRKVDPRQGVLFGDEVFKPHVVTAPQLELTRRLPEPGSYTPFRKGKVPRKGDPVLLFDVNGTGKLVRFVEIDDHRAFVQWPISADMLEVSLKLGTCKAGAHTYWLEDQALEACRLKAQELAESRRITNRLAKNQATG